VQRHDETLVGVWAQQFSDSSTLRHFSVMIGVATMVAIA
jgi:hypothetical protein